ncbi:MAG: hypothetical protein AAFP19_25490, partial [Bacteroidota bacterium]
LLDFGRIVLCLALVGLLFGFWRKGKKLSVATKEILALLFILALLLLPSMLLHRVLLGHRYLLPITMVMTFLFLALLLDENDQWKWRRPLYDLALLSLIIGHLWVYPRSIAQGWDASLAHWPYYDLRDRAIAYIEREALPIDQIGTAFPNIAPFRLLDLSDDTQSFAPLNLAQQKYVLYSNVFNDLSDAQLAELDQDWTILQRWDQRMICFILYQKK